MAEGSLFVISGPAGSGKSTIVQKLIAEHPDVRVSVSCTTRAMRPGEAEGVSYHYVSEAEFDKLIAEDAFYEWAHVHENRYGTLKRVVKDELARGHDLILEIDVQGCLNVMKQEPAATGIFICPPSAENLERRLRDRGTEAEHSIRVRLGNAGREVAQAPNYKYMVVHHDWHEMPDALDRAVDDVYAIIRARRLETAQNREFIDELTRELTSKEGD